MVTFTYLIFHPLEGLLLLQPLTLRRYHGVCALVSSSTTTMTLTNNNSLMISHSDCDRANEAAASRLSQLQRKIRNRRIDLFDGPFRFQEVVCRDERRRYNMPVPWNGAADVNVGTERP
jgi:phosphotransacetylase